MEQFRLHFPLALNQRDVYDELEEEDGLEIEDLLYEFLENRVQEVGIPALIRRAANNHALESCGVQRFEPEKEVWKANEDFMMDGVMTLMVTAVAYSLGEPNMLRSIPLLSPLRWASIISLWSQRPEVLPDRAFTEQWRQLFQNAAGVCATCIDMHVDLLDEDLIEQAEAAGMDSIEDTLAEDHQVFHPWYHHVQSEAVLSSLDKAKEAFSSETNPLVATQFFPQAVGLLLNSWMLENCLFIEDLLEASSDPNLVETQRANQTEVMPSTWTAYNDAELTTIHGEAPPSYDPPGFDVNALASQDETLPKLAALLTDMRGGIGSVGSVTGPSVYIVQLDTKMSINTFKRARCSKLWDVHEL